MQGLLVGLAMIRYAELAQTFDATSMQQEVARLETTAWQLHYNERHYDGRWEVLPLRSPGGNINDIVALHATARTADFENTSLLNHCPYLSSVMSWFQCELTFVRLMKLEAGAVIKPHSDRELSFEDGEVRFHVPVQTNAEVLFQLEEDKLHLAEGSCWYLNFSLTHAVENLGNSARIHLVLDARVNDWVRQQLDFSKQISRGENPAVESISVIDQRKVIAELRMMNTETSLRLALEMESRLPPE